MVIKKRRPRGTAVDHIGSFNAAFVVKLPQPSLTLNSPQSGMAEGASDAAQSNKRKHSRRLLLAKLMRITTKANWITGGASTDALNDDASWPNEI
jgi:hypothetical protein